MGGAALAEVELDRVGLPLAGVVLHGHEVDREATQHALVGQAPPDGQGGLGDLAGVRRIGGEHAPEVLLPAGPAEQLVVGRQQLDRAVGQDPHLHARAGQRRAGDALLHDAAELLERDQEVARREVGRLGLQARGGAAHGAPPRRPGAGAPRSTSALPDPDTPSLILTITSARPAAGPHPGHGPDEVVQGREVLGPHGRPDAHLVEQPAAARLAAERCEPRVRAVDRDAEAERDVPLQLGRGVRDQVAEAGRG